MFRRDKMAFLRFGRSICPLEDRRLALGKIMAEKHTVLLGPVLSSAWKGRANVDP
jgi:hypothetical protein